MWGRREGCWGERFPPSSMASCLARPLGCCFHKCYFHSHLSTRNLESKSISQAVEPRQAVGSGMERRGISALPAPPPPAPVTPPTYPHTRAHVRYSAWNSAENRNPSLSEIKLAGSRGSCDGREGRRAKRQ